MIATLLALMLAADADSAASPPPPKVEVVWTRLPQWQELLDAYPARAWNSRASGRAVLSCAVTAKGRLTRCEVRSEDPGGYGFASAALRLAAKFQVAPAHEGGVVAGGRIEVPIVFRMPATY